MAFIKRSTTKIVKATVGKKINKCKSCGMLFVGPIHTTMCHKCNSQSINNTTQINLENSPEIND